MNIFELFKKPARTADELRLKLNEVVSQLPALETVLEAARAERAAGLLTMPDKEVERIEGRIATAARDVDRTKAVREELTRRLREAEEREKAERLALIRREAEDLARQTAHDVRVAYSELGVRLAIVLEAARRVDLRIIEANEALRTGGATDQVETVADRVAMRSGVGMTLDLFGVTSIAPIGGPGWGEARRQAQRIGIDQVAAE